MRVLHTTLAGQPIGVIEISFIECDHNFFRKAVEESIHLLGRNHGAGGIVGVGDKDESGLRVDGVGNGVKVVTVIAAWDLTKLGARRAGDDGIDDERALAGYGIVPRGKKRAGENVQQVAGAGGDDQLIR